MALHFLGDEERVKDALNPADPLMIPLYECCCFISPIRAGMGGTFSRCCVRAFLCAADGGAKWKWWFLRDDFMTSTDYRLPPLPSPHPTLQLPKFTPFPPPPHRSGSTAARRITKRGLAVTSHQRDGWARVRGRASTWVWVCEWMGRDGCERFVCVRDWLDDEGSGEREARIREPSESWLGADTTPPHQGSIYWGIRLIYAGLGLLSVQWGNFFITVTLQPVKCGHLWDIYWCIYHILGIIWCFFYCCN